MCVVEHNHKLSGFCVEPCWGECSHSCTRAVAAITVANCIRTITATAVVTDQLSETVCECDQCLLVPVSVAFAWLYACIQRNYSSLLFSVASAPGSIDQKRLESLRKRSCWEIGPRRAPVPPSRGGFGSRYFRGGRVEKCCVRVDDDTAIWGSLRKHGGQANLCACAAEGLDPNKDGLPSCFDHNLRHGCKAEVWEVTDGTRCKKSLRACMRCGGKVTWCRRARNGTIDVSVV